MKVVADESVDYGIIGELQNRGIEVYSIVENKQGINDIEVLKIANEHRCLLITEDKDFGELTYRLQLSHFGILLIRLTGIPRTDRITIISDIVINHFEELQNNFSVLNQQGLRIKKSKNDDLNKSR